eukprot:CAMPEP_0184327660 /NCGR_PEP_ID=MMETSP1049-20130417/143209_1 /TAXON_ID=77928 /ORGANISM="Proteomonas sulcata, Strain CCMP704" /LENGTH=332 /DNA_ID=CAMNT_0026649925 /DNA_START=1 /DNA_END=999 /DNA_ORIENTATION=+
MLGHSQNSPTLPASTPPSDKRHPDTSVQISASQQEREDADILRSIEKSASIRESDEQIEVASSSKKEEGDCADPEQGENEEANAKAPIKEPSEPVEAEIDDNEKPSIGAISDDQVLEETQSVAEEDGGTVNSARIKSEDADVGEEPARPVPQDGAHSDDAALTPGEQGSPLNSDPQGPSVTKIGQSSPDEVFESKMSCLLKVLSENRIVDVSPVERWVFQGHDADTSHVIFDKAKASNIQAWEGIVAQSFQDAGGLRSKVLVLRYPVPETTARFLVSSGAEAVIMPASDLSDPHRLEVEHNLYAALAQGKSPAIAVAECNCGNDDALFDCVH